MNKFNLDSVKYLKRHLQRVDDKDSPLRCYTQRNDRRSNHGEIRRHLARDDFYDGHLPFHHRLHDDVGHDGRVRVRDGLLHDDRHDGVFPSRDDRHDGVFPPRDDRHDGVCRLHDGRHLRDVHVLQLHHAACHLGNVYKITFVHI